MLYFNSNLRPDAHLRTLLAHEYTHAVSFSLRLPSSRNPAGLRDEEDWLSEAIAHLAENLHGADWSNLDYRISRFLNDPQRFPLVVADYYRAGLWRDHGCRGATYLFLRWCVDQYGAGLLSDLLRSPATGTRNLERATGVPFPMLYRHWTMALLESGTHGSRTRELPVPTTAGPLSGRSPGWGRVREWNGCRRCSCNREIGCCSRFRK